MNTFSVEDITPQAGAGIEVVAPRTGLVPAIQQTFDRLYKADALAPGHGHNFILYHAWSPSDVRMTVGVLDRAPGGVDPDVKDAHVPGGRTITATHWGDYGQMKSTYDGLYAEVNAKGLKLTPLSLEIYGDWSDDPSRVRTDIYLFLAVGI